MLQTRTLTTGAHIAGELKTVKGSADIDPVTKAHSTVYVTDSGTALTFYGQGDGFVAGLPYLSLIYDNGSTATGPGACLPGIPNSPVPAGLPMFVGYWLPMNSTHRVLSVVKTGASYVPLSSIGTMSIRYDSQFANPIPATMASQQNPGRLFLQSCGKL